MVVARLVHSYALMLRLQSLYPSHVTYAVNVLLCNVDLVKTYTGQRH
jgi:hypothetical protein